jgi:hypothetical protein
MQVMGIALAKYLNDYFTVSELKDALSNIGELTTGTKIELVKRLVAQWESHNRDKYDLLDFLDEDVLANLCDDYNIGSNGDENLLKRRIKKARLLDGNSPRPSSMVDDRLISNKKTFEKMGLGTDFKKADDFKQNSSIKYSTKKSFFSIRNILIILVLATVTTILVNLTNIVEFFSKH